MSNGHLTRRVGEGSRSLFSWLHFADAFLIAGVGAARESVNYETYHKVPDYSAKQAMIHPILQLFRLSVEMYLKAAISYLHWIISKNREDSANSLKSKGHKLDSLFSSLESEVNYSLKYFHIDERPTNLSKSARETIKYFVELDPKGTLTRYPCDEQGIPLSENLDFSVNLQDLVDKMEKFKIDFERYFSQFDYLADLKEQLENAEDQYHQY